MFETFTINNEADPSGTCLQGYLVGNYKKIVEMFGEPIESDGYKVSAEWVFVSEKGDVVTLYDWKSTNLYDDDLPSVEEFRELDQYKFHIGAKDKATALNFQDWFMAQLTPKIGGEHE